MREVGVGELEVGDIGTVDLELELVVVVKNREGGGIGRGEVLDGVVEVELLYLGTGGDRLLNLGDEEVHGLGREKFTFLGIEEGVVRVDIPLLGAVRRGRTPSDPKLDIMVLERNEWEGSLPVLTESKPEGVETLIGGATVEVTSDRLGGGGRGEHWGNEGRVGGILFINHLTTHEELDLGDHSRPVSNRCRRGTRVGYEVDIVEHVTLALEADGGHTIVRDVALNDLTFDSLGEIGVAFVVGSEETDLGLTHEVDVLSSDGYELGNTTRHFII